MFSSLSDEWVILSWEENTKHNLNAKNPVLSILIFKQNFFLVQEYSKNPHKGTGVLGVQADFVLIDWVVSAKSA